MFDRKIMKDFKDNFLYTENALYAIYDEKEKLSVYDIFLAGKLRNEKLLNKIEELLSQIYSDFSIVQSISFLPLDNFSILINFINGKSGRIVLNKDNKLAFEACTELSKVEQKFILDNYEQRLKQFLLFGGDNKYDEFLKIKTISGNYDIQLFPNRFSICKSNSFKKLTGKRLDLHYFFDRKVKANSIETDLGIFNVRTNILGVYNILKKTKKESGNLKTSKFLDNLQVYENDVPEYLKQEIQKVKVLKK